MKIYKGKLRFKGELYNFETSGIYDYWIHITPATHNRYFGMIDTQYSTFTNLMNDPKVQPFKKEDLIIMLPVEEVTIPLFEEI